MSPGEPGRGALPRLQSSRRIRRSERASSLTSVPARTSGWQDSRLGSTILRLRRSKMVGAAGCFLLLMVVVAGAAPLFAPYDPLAMQPAVRF